MYCIRKMLTGTFSVYCICFTKDLQNGIQA